MKETKTDLSFCMKNHQFDFDQFITYLKRLVKTGYKELALYHNSFINCYSLDEDDDILEIDSEDISAKREDLKSCYRAPFNFFDVWEFKVDDNFKLMREDGLSSKLEFFERALDDSETVDAVRKMRDDSFEVSKKNEGEGVKEIQSMRRLLDIMARNIKGELTEQDKMELKDKAEEWSRDIETLLEMVNKSSM